MLKKITEEARMLESSTILQLFAYYLSEYDMKAVEALGFSNRSEAFTNIGKAFGRDNHYLKLRRDEFDVVTSSHRNGWRNRKPTVRILEFSEYFRKLLFVQLTEIAQALLQG